MAIKNEPDTEHLVVENIEEGEISRVAGCRRSFLCVSMRFKREWRHWCPVCRRRYFMFIDTGAT